MVRDETDLVVKIEREKETELVVKRRGDSTGEGVREAEMLTGGSKGRQSGKTGRVSLRIKN